MPAGQSPFIAHMMLIDKDGCFDWLVGLPPQAPVPASVPTAIRAGKIWAGRRGTVVCMHMKASGSV